jgi:hypothetical protein
MLCLLHLRFGNTARASQLLSSRIAALLRSGCGMGQKSPGQSNQHEFDSAPHETTPVTNDWPSGWLF